MAMLKGTVIGIDLGTTHSCVAYLDETKTPRVIDVSRKTPSVVALSRVNKLVGAPAKEQAFTNPKSTFSATKRYIGRRFEDEEVKKNLKTVSYQLIKANNGDVWMAAGDGTKYPPSQIGAFLVTKMKEIAESYLMEPIKDAVITVPSCFNDSQRQATKDAGIRAGLKVVHLINESTAAAQSYRFDKTEDKLIAVYHLGGGSFDTSIIEVKGGHFQVRSTNGNTSLGGVDFDNALLDYIISETKGNKAVKDPIALQRLRVEAEKAKIELTFSDKANINSVGIQVTVDKFESLVSPLIDQTIACCQQAVKDANISTDDIQEVILTGGMTQMPLVQQRVREFFGIFPSNLEDPDMAAALGAAIQGGILSGAVKEITSSDVTPLSIGIATPTGEFTKVIPRNTTVPTKKSKVFTTEADGQTSIKITVHQGEQPMAADNKLIGHFEVRGVLPAPSKATKIEVTLHIDASSIVYLSAKDVVTGEVKEIVEIH